MIQEGILKLYMRGRTQLQGRGEENENVKKNKFDVNFKFLAVATFPSFSTFFEIKTRILT
jgi:hypothetical protein